MAPKRRAGKEVATSAAEGPSPPPVEQPIAGRELSLLIRDCHLSFEADSWLSLNESRAIDYNLILLGNLVP